MKKKRILLHICILLLAVVCMGAGMYVCYWDEKIYSGDYEYEYNESYVSDVVELLHYADAQLNFCSEFGDENKVLITDKELGNVSVKDIVEIFSDKYYNYYNGDNYWADYADYNESFGYIEEGESTTATLYDIDYAQMKKYRSAWKKNNSEDSKHKYQYYKKKCDYVNRYAELAEVLLWELREDGTEIVDFDPLVLIHETYRSVCSGMKYYIKYTLNNKMYFICNGMSDAPSEKEGFIDITSMKDGKLVQDSPLYGVKDFEGRTSYFVSSDFLEKVDELYIGIDSNDVNSHYSSLIEKIKEQPTDAEMQHIENNFKKCFVVVIVTLTIAMILYILLMLMAGHKEKGDKPQLCGTDHLLWDMEFIIAAIVTTVVYFILEDKIWDEGYHQIFAISIAILALPAIETFVLLSESLMRRLKTRSFMQTTLFGKLWGKIKIFAEKLMQGIGNLMSNMNLTVKVIVFGIIAVICTVIEFIIVENCYHFFSALIVISIPIGCVCYLVWKYFNESKIVEEGAKKISGGELNYKISEKMKFTANRVLKDCVNNIGEGLNAAVEESIRNERMKTELITNVSHDLKTPLTSIINYVDLLKTDGLDSEKAGKYLDILDQKSQRLKHLTEDLVEVSKLNSGAVELTREKLDLVQLVNQSLGEYNEKFERKNLQVVKTVQEEPLYVMADGRKTWRLFENLYENVYKYAMAGTRVYVDIRTKHGKVEISVKNISESPLNFSADELMERFVRGDVSRTTEGSGLGLSIAKTIVERQDGEMKIVLDGDLFKVEIMMNLI
ncbi:MAG: sensor histidine kinase [Eubacterium sp.]